MDYEVSSTVSNTLLDRRAEINRRLDAYSNLPIALRSTYMTRRMVQNSAVLAELDHIISMLGIENAK